MCHSKTKAGWTPLHFAAKNGYDNLLDYLIRKKSAVVDSMTMKKQTPLHFAATNGQVQVFHNGGNDSYIRQSQLCDQMICQTKTAKNFL